MRTYLGRYSASNIDSYLAKFGLRKNATPAEIHKAVKRLKPEQEEKILRRIAIAGDLKNLENQTRNARRLRKIYADRLTQKVNEIFDKLGSDEALSQLEERIVGRTTTTHPLAIKTAKEEFLDTAHAKRLHRLWDLKYTLRTITDDASRSRIENEIRKTEAQIQRFIRRKAALPFHNEARLTGLDEVSRQIPYLKNAALGWAEANTLLKETIYRKTGAVAEYIPSESASWDGMDFDRNKYLRPKDIFETARRKAEAAFQLHARELKKTANEIGSKDATLNEELSTIRRRLLNTAYGLERKLHLHGKKRFHLPGRRRLLDNGYEQYLPQGQYSNYGSYTRADDYIQELRALRNRSPRHRWQIERLISLAQETGFHLTEGEARQNAEPLADNLRLVSDKANLNISRTRSTVRTEIARFRKIAGHFDQIKEVDLSSLDYSSLPEGRVDEARKYISCLEQFARTREKFGPKSVSRIVIAEASNPADKLSEQALGQNVGLITGAPDDPRIIALVESGDDKFFMRASMDEVKRLSSAHSPAGKAARAFLHEPEIMQAASDTLRVDGHINGIRANYAFAHHLTGEYPHARLYWGIGAKGPRMGDLLPHEVIERLFPVKRFRQTIQGSQVQMVNRTPVTAVGHNIATLSAFISKSFEPDQADIYKAFDPPIKAWSAETARSHVRMVTGKTASIDQALNKLTMARFVSSINAGLRSGAGELGVDYVDLSGFKEVTHKNSRAISLSLSGGTSGFDSVTLGEGHGLARTMRKNRNLLSTLHEAHLNVPGLRLTNEGAACIKAHGYYYPIKRDFAEELRGDRVLRNFVNYHERDSNKLKHGLVKIIQGISSRKAFDELPQVIRALGTPFWYRIGQTSFSKNLAPVLRAAPTERLIGTSLGRSFKLMRIATASLIRISGRFA